MIDRTCSSVARGLAPLLPALLALVTGGSALVSGCSAIVQPDPDRLRPRADGGPTIERDGGGLGDDAGPLCPAGCDDGVDCTVDACGASGCEHTGDDAACGETMRCNPVMGCVPLRCTRDDECDDGRPCNGIETCDAASPDATGCVAGEELRCDDGIACTADACIDAEGGCVAPASHAMCDDAISCTVDICAPTAPGRDAEGCTHAGDDAMCNDGFCFTGGTCDPGSGCVGARPRDCRDFDPCDVEECDPVAAACVSTPVDADMDGHPAASVTMGAIRTLCPGATDCDDTSDAVHPGAEEACNGVDDDCDRTTDEGCPPALNDTCETAAPITIDGSGRGAITASLEPYSDDLTFCMGGRGGRDAVYYFDVASLSDVVLDTSGSAVGLDTMLAVTHDCAVAPIVCNDDRDRPSITSSRIFLHRVGPVVPGVPARIYVFVDGFDAEEVDTFTLSVEIRGARPDACGSSPLDISGGGTVYGVGPIGGSASDELGSCQDVDEVVESEGVFRLDAPDDRDHDMIGAYAATFVPDLYLRDGCSRELDCSVGSNVGGGVHLARVGSGAVDGGSTQYLFVDGMTPTAGVPHSYIVAYDP
jgi:hypothetical protein